MNLQPHRLPAAFDSAGHVSEVVFITSTRINEIFGRPLPSKMGALVFCGSKKVAAREVNDGADLRAVLKEFDPTTISVVGTEDEGETIADIERAVAMLLSLPPGGDSIKKEIQ